MSNVKYQMMREKRIGYLALDIFMVVRGRDLTFVK